MQYERLQADSLSLPHLCLHVCIHCNQPQAAPAFTNDNMDLLVGNDSICQHFCLLVQQLKGGTQAQVVVVQGVILG